MSICDVVYTIHHRPFTVSYSDAHSFWPRTFGPPPIPSDTSSENLPSPKVPVTVIAARWRMFWECSTFQHHRADERRSNSGVPLRVVRDDEIEMLRHCS
jgi:hypothetical protein